MIWGLIGAFIAGCACGVFLMALMIANRRD